MGASGLDGGRWRYILGGWDWGEYFLWVGESGWRLVGVSLVSV